VAWFFLVLGIVLLGRTNRSHAVVLAAAVLVVAAVGLFTAQDLSRAMMLVMPAALLGAVYAPALRPWWLATAAALALLLPAHHVMTNRVNPIFYLYHELGAFERPPPEAMPELLELRALQAMEQGDFTTAAESLSLAIKLAPNPAYPSRQRGILFASQQQWAAAREDFSVAVKHAPREPDGWFLRAQAALALGDVAAANADFTQALAVASPKWQERADVTRFRTRLRQQTGGR
jgi:tetratricopeptide (TPR) repeat protein